MVHLWQFHFGKPGRGYYHNREWAEKMEAIGLMPSDTGKPGGKKTGDSVSDYPISGGKFLTACDSLLTDDYKISWVDRFPPKRVTDYAMNNNANEIGENIVIEETQKATREKFTCPKCHTNVWGKPSLRLICPACGSFYVNPSEIPPQAEVQTGAGKGEGNAKPLIAVLLEHARPAIFDSDWFKSAPGVGITLQVRDVETRETGHVVIFDVECGGLKSQWSMPLNLEAIRLEG
jgi:ribosomal protein S27E